MAKFPPMTLEQQRNFYRLRLQYLNVPTWRDDPAYFWAEQTKARKAIPWSCPKKCHLCRPHFCVGYCR